jgi:hypothetical protein
MRHLPAGPYDLADDAAYRAWRSRKLDTRAHSIADLAVEVADPLRLTDAERAALLERCARTNLAVYVGPPLDAERAALAVRRIGEQLGLRTLDRHYLAEGDGITALADTASGARSGYIPYTNRAIRWHTDGYYHPPGRRIRTMLLHCVQRAASGGENRLLDHELAYLALRDQDPGHVAALMRPDAMTIPARAEEGEIARGDQTGPVYSVDASGHLHMRYTARTRSIAWHEDPAVRAAAEALQRVLASSAHVLELRQEPGMGIVCNNVLHDRAAFTDSPAHTRLVLRARYHERIGADPAGSRDEKGRHGRVARPAAATP